MFDYKAFRDLCFDKGVSESAVAKAIGLSRASVSQWRTGRSQPSELNLSKLAKYFDVDVSALSSEPAQPVGIVPVSVVTESEMRLVGLYRHLTDANKEKVQEYIEFLASKQPKEKRTVG